MIHPKYYMQTYYEPRQGFKYEQPVQKINGKSFYEYKEDSFERKNWGSIYWESKKYNDAIEYSKYNSELWTNEKSKLNAFDKIYNFILNGKSVSGSSVTPLFPFEIHLMNNGFKMISFSELNAINPSVHLQISKGLCYSRYYKKKNKYIFLGFGFEYENKKTNFYFKTSTSKNYYQVDNSIENYKKAINDKLNPLNK